VCIYIYMYIYVYIYITYLFIIYVYSLFVHRDADGVWTQLYFDHDIKDLAGPVYIYIGVCVCIYIYTYMYIYIYIYVYTYTHIHIFRWIDIDRSRSRCRYMICEYLYMSIYVYNSYITYIYTPSFLHRDADGAWAQLYFDHDIKDLAGPGVQGANRLNRALALAHSNAEFSEERFALVRLYKHRFCIYRLSTFTLYVCMYIQPYKPG